MVQFSSEKISNVVTKLRGITGELMYLIEGSESAALVDTGSGVGSLQAYVATLTKKPLIILLTHGHVDHAMGAPEFLTGHSTGVSTKIYMNPLDDEVCDEHSTLDVRKGYLSMSESFKEVIDEDYIPIRENSYLPLTQGDVFDLGGITLEAFACPGHTPGSMTILIKEERTLILGDACNFFTFVFDKYAVSVAQYKQILENLNDLTKDKYDKVYVSHGPGEGPKEMITNVIQVCAEVLAGTSDDVPFEFMGQKAFIAKAMNPTTMQRVDGGCGNIVYSQKE